MIAVDKRVRVTGGDLTGQTGMVVNHTEVGTPDPWHLVLLDKPDEKTGQQQWVRESNLREES